MQAIYVNSSLMKRSGDDTEFTVELGAQYSFKRLVLNSFSCENLVLNMYDDFQDFSFQFDNGTNTARLI